MTGTRWEWRVKDEGYSMTLEHSGNGGVKDEGYSTSLKHDGNGGLRMRVIQRDWNTVGMES